MLQHNKQTDTHRQMRLNAHGKYFQEQYWCLPIPTHIHS